MTPALNTATLFAGVVVLLLLPLIPAITEYWRKTDALPLRVIQDHAGEIRHFSHSFREFVHGLQGPLRECALQGTTSSGKLPDGSEYILVGRSDVPFLTRQELERELTDRVILCARSFQARDRMVFAKEMHMLGDLQGGAGNFYRAVLAERDAYLGAGSTVLRWMHVVGALHAEANCTFHGRLSSDGMIQLERGCKFERMNAPRIEFGNLQPKATAAAGKRESQLDVPLQRLLFDGDFDVPAGKFINVSIVASGTIHIGRGARIGGSVKSNCDLLMEDGAHVEGSAICGRKMRIGRNCVLHGPVLAEHGLWIRSRTVCGSEQQPTTVSAPEIHLAPGVVVYGTVWAKEKGTVEG